MELIDKSLYLFLMLSVLMYQLESGDFVKISTSQERQSFIEKLDEVCLFPFFQVLPYMHIINILNGVFSGTRMVVHRW